MRLRTDFDTEKEKVERVAEYLSCVLIYGTKVGANNYGRRLQRNTHGFEALRLLRLIIIVTWLIW